MNDKITYQILLEKVRSFKYEALDAWPVIEKEMELYEQVSKLPKHKVTKDIWANIEESLEPQTPSTFRQFLLWSSIVLIACILGFIVLKYNNVSSTEKFVYSSEIELVENITFQNVETIQKEEPEGTDYISKNDFLFSIQNLDAFEKEINQLNEDLNELKSISENYGMDDDILKSIAKMERQKAELIKSMINRT